MFPDVPPPPHAVRRSKIEESKNKLNGNIDVADLKEKINETQSPFTDKQIKYFDTFQTNLKDGIKYYKKMFLENRDSLKETYDKVISDLENLELELKQFMPVAV